MKGISKLHEILTLSLTMKLHIDQNEKLVMYDTTHVIARDGYSGMVVAIATMPVKNNLTMYEEIFR